MMNNCLRFVLASTAVMGATGAFAIDIYGLTTRDQLVRFDSATPGAIQNAVFVNGLASNESLVGIDFRPSNGMLYGVGSFGRIYTLNTVTGAATFVSSLTNAVGGGPITLQGVEFGVDFNPVVDRLRITSDLDMNLRVNVATGATNVDGTLNGSTNPNIVASAYANNFAGVTSTTLYNLDSASDMLTIQNPPNAGTQVNVGSLGLDISALAGMDIQTIGSTNVAYAALQNQNGSGSSLYTISLTSGSATAIGVIGNSQSSDALAIRDLAVTAVPEPATMAAIGIGIAALLRRKRK